MQYSVNFGQIGPFPKTVPGPAFRLAVIGDFSARASAGVVETGAKLAARKPHKVDVDDLDDLIERLNLAVSVPVDEAGNVLSVPIRCMDDFHPDQLVETIPALEALLQLRRNLQSRSGFDRAAKEVLSWSNQVPLPPVASRRARGGAIATDRKLSDFARLTGRQQGSEADPDDLIRRLVGPFIVPERDARQDAMVARVDAALSAAMRRVLHHPDFQMAEALWRGLDLLVRRVQTGAKMQIVLYDMSAEELAADLAAADALENSALYSLLIEQPAMDAGQGPLSLLAGMYQFEASPPHADLLGRLAQLAGAAGAPFITGIGPDGLKAPIHDWHPITRQAWEALRALPASAYLGLATPRFLLRLPYGKRTDPIDAFMFEEFSRETGLSGMLYGHPAWLVATLVAQTWLRDPKTSQLGSAATIGDLPVYLYHDTDGEQIALPCTERLFSERQAVQIASLGVNPAIALRGRPEIRIAGFRSLGGAPLAGRWAPVDLASLASSATPAPAPPLEPAIDALLDDLQPTAAPEPEKPEPEKQNTPPAEDDLDSLLASLNVEPPPPVEGNVDADLDALLASLK